MLTRLTLSILATLAPLVARAAESTACDHAALARAEAAAVTAQRTAFESFDPAEGRIARELVAAAVEQVRAARALCDVHAPSQADPFEAVDVDTSDPGAWLAQQSVTADVVERFEAAVRP